MTKPLLVGLAPTHPGEILREDMLPSLGMAKAEVARLLRVSRQTLYDILNEQKPVTPQMAVRLGRLFGNSAEFWLRPQQNHDLRTAGMADELAAIPAVQFA